MILIGDIFMAVDDTMLLMLLIEDSSLSFLSV